LTSFRIEEAEFFDILSVKITILCKLLAQIEEGISEIPSAISVESRNGVPFNMQFLRRKRE
jgi:hypothetical protein